MDPGQQERRIGTLFAILALLTVTAFWMLYPQKLPFRYGREAGLKRALGSIHQPAGDAPGTILVNSYPGINVSTATGAYLTKSDCATVEAHYKQEFAKHGFTYTGTKEASKTESQSLSFTSRDYDAKLSCADNTEGVYLILMKSNSHD